MLEFQPCETARIENTSAILPRAERKVTMLVACENGYKTSQGDVMIPVVCKGQGAWQAVEQCTGKSIYIKSIKIYTFV